MLKGRRKKQEIIEEYEKGTMEHLEIDKNNMATHRNKAGYNERKEKTA